MAITQRRMTLEEFLKLPEEEPALELIDGWVTQKVSPKARHGRLQLALGSFVNGFGEPRRLAIALPETRVTFAGSSFVPDLVVFRWDRIPLDERGEILDDILIPPDIAVEIISPGQTVKELADRCRWYVEHDVEIALLVNTRNRSVTLFRRATPPLVLTGPDRIDLDSVLPGFQLTVEQLFSALSLR
jgi:Uma2 family endonuclease